MSIAVASLEQSLLADITRFKQEALAVHDALVLPTWMGPLHGFNQTLYGYMMGTFSFIDLLSLYWSGPAKGGKPSQTTRMVDFMEKYMNSNREAYNLAVQLWRHKLMHTSRPRTLSDPATGKKFYWLLQWFEPHLPREQHYTFSDTNDMKILNLGAIYLIEAFGQKTHSRLSRGARSVTGE